MASPTAPSPAVRPSEPGPAAASRAGGVSPGPGRRWARPIVALLLGALVLRLALWARAYGFEQGDPVEYVNIAYKIAFGIGIPWWDLRPLLLPLVYVPVLYLAQLWPDPSGEAMVRALRLVGVLFSLGSVWLVYLLGRHLGGVPVGLASALLVAVNPVFNRLSVSTFAEVPSTFFVLLAIWSLARTPRRPLLAGLALGAACMIRYQAIAFVAPVGLWALWRATKDEGRRTNDEGQRGAHFRPSSFFRFGAGLGVAALAQAAIETVAYGRPFHSLLASFRYNVTSGLAPAEFGSEPFEWFLLRTPEWFGSPAFLLALVGLGALSRGPRAPEWRLVGLSAATMFLVLSALPHKELRFVAQVLPLLALFAGQGTLWMVGRLVSFASERSGVRAPLVPTTLLALAVALPLLWATIRLDLEADVAYVDGPKRAAELRPGGTMGTIPWFVPRPYTGSRLTLERMDRKIWDDREHVARTVAQSDFLLFPEYWLLEDREVRRLVDANYRTLESYDNGVVLLQNRRLDEDREPDQPARRRPRS